MDRISAVLILGILVLLIMSGHMVYDMWKAEGDMEYEVLIFNDDTSVTNNSDSNLWIRARIADVQIYDADRLIFINDTSWIGGNDGWYYYSNDLGADQTTEPFVKSGDISPYHANAAAGGTLRVDVEAVDQEWLTERPSGCKEAFELLRMLQKAAEPIYL